MKKRVLAVAAVFGRLLFRMRLAGRGAPSTTMIWPSLEPVATSLLPSWSMIETQQTPERLAAALTAGFLSTWTMAISSADGCPEGLSRGDRRPGCLGVVSHVCPAQARAFYPPPGERCWRLSSGGGPSMRAPRASQGSLMKMRRLRTMKRGTNPSTLHLGSSQSAHA